MCIYCNFTPIDITFVKKLKSLNLFESNLNLKGYYF